MGRKPVGRPTPKTIEIILNKERPYEIEVNGKKIRKTKHELERWLSIYGKTMDVEDFRVPEEKPKKAAVKKPATKRKPRSKKVTKPAEEDKDTNASGSSSSTKS